MTTITIKRDLLEIALRYANDQRLVEDEYDKRKRSETNQDHSDRISSVMQRNEDLREFIQELEAALAAQPKPLFADLIAHLEGLADELAAMDGPAWHDAPTVPGLWLNSVFMKVEDVEQWHIDCQLHLECARWFGPIPKDTK